MSDDLILQQLQRFVQHVSAFEALEDVSDLLGTRSGATLSAKDEIKLYVRKAKQIDEKNKKRAVSQRHRMNELRTYLPDSEVAYQILRLLKASCVAPEG